jgi:hypothetical protein
MNKWQTIEKYLDGGDLNAAQLSLMAIDHKEPIKPYQLVIACVIEINTDYKMPNAWLCHPLGSKHTSTMMKYLIKAHSIKAKECESVIFRYIEASAESIPHAKERVTKGVSLRLFRMGFSAASLIQMGIADSSKRALISIDLDI